MERRWKCKNYLYLARIWTRISVRRVRTVKYLPARPHLGRMRGCYFCLAESLLNHHVHPGVLRPSSPLLLVLVLILKGEETHVVALLSAEVCLSICLLVAGVLTKEPETKG